MTGFTQRAWRGVAPNSQNLIETAAYVWNTNTLAWEPASGSTTGTDVIVTNFPATQPVSIAATVETQDKFYISVLDEPSSSVTYVGKALPGTATSSASWQIIKLTVSGTQLLTTAADGNSNFDNVWDNRASLSYS